MSRLVSNNNTSLTTSSGTDSENTNNLVGVIEQIIVKPTTASTQYDIKIVNGDSLTVFERTSETGELSEHVNIPTDGFHTITITNATADEAFTVQCNVVR